MEEIDFASLYQFDDIYLIDQAKEVISVSPTPILKINTSWLVIGQEVDRLKITQILAAAPFQFTETDFTFLQTSQAVPVFSHVLEQEQVQKLVLLGEEFYTMGLPQEPGAHAGKIIYHFPRTIDSLTDEEKELKRLFWNQLKKML